MCVMYASRGWIFAIKSSACGRMKCAGCMRSLRRAFTTSISVSLITSNDSSGTLDASVMYVKLPILYAVTTICACITGKGVISTPSTSNGL